MVMGGESSCGFKSLRRILDSHNILHIFFVIFVMFI